jgi:hypothetical protein
MEDSMRGARASLLLISIVTALCLAAAPARAQTAPVITLDDFRSIADVVAAVSLQAPKDVNQRPECEDLGLPCLTPPTFTGLGFALSTALYPTALVAIVGEVSDYPNDWASYQPNCDLRHSICVVEQTNHVRAALAGLKVRTPLISGGSTRGRFFVQALAGPQWSDIGPRQLVFQPGVGYDGYFQNGIAFRIELDYRFAAGDVRDLSTSRVLAGIAVPIGLR